MTPVSDGADRHGVVVAVAGHSADDDEVAAIVAALSLTNGAVSQSHHDDVPSWRWAGRWWTKPVPLARVRPW